MIVDARVWLELELVPGTAALSGLATALDSGQAFELVEGGTYGESDVPALALRRTAADLPAQLAGFVRTAALARRDRGEHLLWLSLGTLAWRPVGSADPAALRHDPLWLVPIAIERDEAELRAATGLAPRLNPVLARALRLDDDLELAVGDGAATLVGVLEAAERVAAGRPGWAVIADARIGVYSLEAATLADARDRLDPQTVATALTSRAGSVIIGGLGTLDLHAPLDADASQLAVVAAAAEGASFTVMAAPGTGASQTITNLVVHCATQGKSILVVSDRLAGLAAIADKLAGVGLPELALDLSADDTAPARVLAQLARVTERSFRPGSTPHGADARLETLRDALDAHAAAMHSVGVFGRSVHAVLGRLVELRAADPRLAASPLALADRDSLALDAAAFMQRQQAVEALALAALPVEPVAAHPWRRSQLGAWPAGHESATLAALDEASLALAALDAAVHEIAALVPGLVGRTRDQLVALGTLGAIAARTPRPGAEILTQLRAARDGEVDGQVALVRAKGGGEVEVPRDPLAYLQVAAKYAALRAEVEANFAPAATPGGTPAALELDAKELWTQLKKWMTSVGPVRFMALRGVRAVLRGVAREGQLESDEAMLAGVEGVIALAATRAALAGAAEPAQRWFGELWGDPLATPSGLDHPAIELAVRWAGELRAAFDAIQIAFGEPGRTAAWRALVAQVAATPTGTEPASERAVSPALFDALAAGVARWQPIVARLAVATGIPEAELGAGDNHLVALREQVDTLRGAIASFPAWVAYHAARALARRSSVEVAVTAIERGDHMAEELARGWEHSTLLAWLDAEVERVPVLQQFHGANHHAQVATFADLDRAALALVRSRTLARIAELAPRRARPSLSPSDVVQPTPLDDELALVAREHTRAARAAKPPRQGLWANRGGAERATVQAVPSDRTAEVSAPFDGRDVTTIAGLIAALPQVMLRAAPCWLMTPRTAASLLAEDSKFDVVVIDGAQRLTTADVAPVLAHGVSVVLVGDSKQPSVAPSLVDDAVAARLPSLALAVHYRSKHEDLFAFANARWYGDAVQVLPAAHPAAELGVSWRRVEGVSDQGANYAEAAAVVSEVIARLRDPVARTRSLAVLTFTDAHLRLVSELLDAARAADPQLSGQRDSQGAPNEPVVVAHVDRAQGLERDVVILSLGIVGEDLIDPTSAAAAELTESRLVVATTRAREQLVIAASFAPEEVPEAAAPAVRALAALVAFARDGGGAARPTETTTPASPMMAALGRALVERGWHVRHRVGCGAYQIDLAVSDPSDPERYVLAIEHDGPAYASAPAARDRDRLRGQLLGALGWRVHRVWSLDWWFEPEQEVQRAHQSIVTAIAASRHRRAPVATAVKSAPGRSSAPVVRIPPKAADANLAGSASPASGPIIVSPAGGVASGPLPVELALDSGAAAIAKAMDPAPAFAAGSAPIRLARGAIAIGPYLIAAIPAGRRAPDDMFAPRHLAELGKVVEQVLAAEAPMHVDLLARRVAAYFGIGRVTQRVADQVKVALAGRGRWGDEPDIVWRMDQDPAGVPAVRVASAGATAARSIDEVPLAELASAARIVVERAPGIATKELVRDAARLLGIARLTEDVTARIARGVRLAELRTLIDIDTAGKARMPS